MSHGVRHFCWRNGKPRWIASQGDRALGFKGQDLKDDDGNWLPLQKALRAAEKINSELDMARRETGGAPRTRSVREKKSSNLHAEGYVYFVWTSARVKIGFSTDPFRRMREIKTFVSDPIERFVVLRGTKASEARLHNRFSSLRSSGEWFRFSDELDQLILQMVAAGSANIR